MTMEEEVLIYTAGSAWNPELEDANMYQTDSRDRAADRDADTYEQQRFSRNDEQIKADEDLFKENAKLFDLRKDLGTYGYSAWCDAAVSSPSGLWNNYDAVHGINIQIAPFTPPSVWQTLLGKEMGARVAHFQSPGRELKYWVIPRQRVDLDS